MRILESKIETEVRDYAEALGYIQFKVSPMGQAGWPDRVFINVFGLHVYMEFKRPGKKLRELQEYRKRQLYERGVYVFGPVDTFQEAAGVLYGLRQTQVDPSRVSNRGNPPRTDPSGLGPIP